ncbi:MAG: hypothetical protein RLZZ543_385 [Bacteroidota bacterium]|jgi:acetyl esterase/lipase
MSASGARSIIGIIRFVLGAILFAYSLLTLVLLQWNEGILYNLAAIEDSGGLCLLSLALVLLPGWKKMPYFKIGLLFPFIAFAFLIAPAIQSSQAFSSVEAAQTPGARNAFSWGRWIKGNKPPVGMEVVETSADDGQILHAMVFNRNGKTGKRVAVLVLHGGGFTAGSAEHGAELAIALADHDWMGISIDYRLAPKSAYPTQINDVAHWIRYFKQHAARWELDTTRFFLAGESAGATIALNAAYTLNDSSIKAVANLYGFTSADSSNAALMNSIAHPIDMLQAYRGSHSFQEISPTEQAKQHAIPTISLHGEKDNIVAPIQAVYLDSVLSQQKIAHQLVLLPWATHLFNHPSFGPSGQLSVEYIDRFFRKHL